MLAPGQTAPDDVGDYIVRHSPTVSIFLGVRWSGLPPRGMEYWDRLNDVIAMLLPLGLEKGKPFKSDSRQTRILTDAALVGEAMARANSAD